MTARERERARERKAEIARERKRERERESGSVPHCGLPTGDIRELRAFNFSFFHLDEHTDSPRLIPHELEEISASSRERGAKGRQVERSSKAINR